MGRYIKNFLAFTIILVSGLSFGQEYDDLYFNKSDREKLKKKRKENMNASVTSDVASDYGVFEETPESDFEPTSFLGKQYDYEPLPTDELVAGTVSQESIDQYKSGKTIEDYQANNSYVSNQSSQNNPTFSNPSYSDPMETFDDRNVTINNYYGNNWGNQWNRPGLRFGIGWNSWGGNFWGVSYGNAWGNPWYDPFWDPWYGNAWGPAWAWDPWWGWNRWGWNSWGWRGYYGAAWCRPYWGGGFYSRPVYVVRGERYRRDVIRGSRNSRGGAVTGRSRSGRESVASRTSSESRDYSRQQRNYLNRSRSSRYSGTDSSPASQVRTNTRSRDNASIGQQPSRSNNSSFNRGNSTRSRSTYTPSRGSGNSRSSGVRSMPSRSSRSSGSVRSSGSSRSSSGRSSRSSSGRSGSRRGN